MTVDEILEASLARLMEFTDKVPGTGHSDLARLNQRQEQLFAVIADVNRDYSGRDAVLTLTAGAADTATLSPQPMRITDVRIENPGASLYLAGRKVHVVPVDDRDCELPPRMTLRDGVLAQVATDLADVTSVRVFYARRPLYLTLRTETPDLPEQYHELLVIDLAKMKVRKMLNLAAQARTDILALFKAEEEELEADFQQHLRNYNFAETARHARTAL